MKFTKINESHDTNLNMPKGYSIVKKNKYIRINYQQSMFLKSKWYLSFALAGLGFIILQILGLFLNEKVGGGILTLELAWTSETLNQSLTRWDHNDLIIKIIFDLFFIPAYTYFFYTSVQLASSFLKTNSFLIRLSKYLIVLSFMPFAFGYSKNAILLMTVSGYYNEQSIQITFILATLKYMSIALIFVYLIVSYFQIRFTKSKNLL